MILALNMSLVDKVKIELANLADIDGITRVLDSVPLRQDFVYLFLLQTFPK